MSRRISVLERGPITLEDIAKDSVTGYDRRLPHPWSKELEQNAWRLKERLNQLYSLLPAELQASFAITSAYRPGEFNTRAGGAAGSLHTTCEAADLANVGNRLGTWLLANCDILEKCSLWLEHPSATLKTRHAHLQTRAPGSGRRVFWP